MYKFALLKLQGLDINEEGGIVVHIMLRTHFHCVLLNLGTVSKLFMDFFLIEATLQGTHESRMFLLIFLLQEREAVDSTADAHTYCNTEGTNPCYAESQSTASSITLPSICYWL
jgi:hypothetical protein